MNMRIPRFFPVAVLAIALSAAAGGVFGSRALARQDEVGQQYRVFTSAVDAIEKEYVDDVPADRVNESLHQLPKDKQLITYCT